MTPLRNPGPRRRALLVSAFAAFAWSLAALATSAASPWHAATIAHPALAAERVPDGAHAGCLVVLLGEHGAPSRSLLLVCDAPGAPEIRSLGSAPDGASSLAFARRSSGLHLLIGVPGGVDAARLDDDGRLVPPVPLLRAAALHPDTLDDRPDLDGDGTRDLVQSLHDGLGAWRVGDDETFEPLGRADIAPRALIFDGEIELAGVAFAPGHERGDGPEVRWGGPRLDVPRRIGVWRVPLAGEDAFTACTAWVRTRHPSAVISSIVLVEPRPRLAALVTRSDRASLLGEYDLLLAPLACDPTRRGQPPEAVLRTPFPTARPARLALRDVTGDGRPDVVAVGIAGRLKPRLAVTAWPRRDDGGLDERALEWSLRIAPSERPFVSWEHDVDGDGFLDLVGGTEDELVIVPGRAPRAGAVPLDEDAARRVPWPAGVEPREVLGVAGGRLVAHGGSLGGDGTAPRTVAELLVLGPEAGP